MTFFIKRAEDARDLPLPARQTAEAAGMDLYANVHAPLCVRKGERVWVSVGIRVALPYGYEAQIRPRSSMVLKGIDMPNTPATVDADYRGELKVILANHSADDFVIRRGDRIAQLVVARVEMITFEETETLPESARGEGGFGSTGK